jgi:RNA polymerase sigma factor (sigma-70 family)
MNNYKIMLDSELVKIYQTKNDSEILELLLERNSNILNKIAHNHTSKYQNTSFEDNKQNAILGAIIAISAFKTSLNVKLSTYLYKSVTMYLLSCNDTEAFVRCPCNARKERSKHISLKPIMIEEKLPETAYYSEDQIVEEINESIFLQSLPENQRNIIVLKLQGYDNEKIARKLSISSKQIKKQLNLIAEIFV